ncbi:hypothetical protein NIES37_55240 [Tolypothrix tenuis PCC 7101]|uniref:Uncharacterized protein n=1 Tax=Tolypothrix tenuis PCC 7101 TaxID=231146 RepID=A0A1Z4N765_9CYAN|nr:hypothetical protein NIES37_55240 [Tolypothrix tenuis PCC 7101]BAZ74555.1 hypothetical protein NIES50_31300 [Aulosira laxa NIES-50]
MKPQNLAGFIFLKPLLIPIQIMLATHQSILECTAQIAPTTCRIILKNWYNFSLNNKKIKGKSLFPFPLYLSPFNLLYIGLFVNY